MNKKYMLFLCALNGCFVSFAFGIAAFDAPIESQAVQPLQARNFDLLTTFKEPFSLSTQLDQILEERESLESDAEEKANPQKAKEQALIRFLTLWNDWRHQAEQLLVKYPKRLFEPALDFYELEKDQLFLESVEDRLMEENEVLFPLVEKMAQYLKTQKIAWREEDAPLFAQNKIMSDQDFEANRDIIRRYQNYDLEDPAFPDLLTSPENSEILADFLRLKSFLKTQQALLTKIAPLAQQISHILQYGSHQIKMFNQLTSFCGENGCSIMNPDFSIEEIQEAQEITRSFFTQYPRFLTDDIFGKRSEMLLQNLGLNKQLEEDPSMPLKALQPQIKAELLAQKEPSSLTFESK